MITFRNSWCEIITGQMAFLLPNRWCQNNTFSSCFVFAFYCASTLSAWTLLRATRRAAGAMLQYRGVICGCGDDRVSDTRRVGMLCMDWRNWSKNNSDAVRERNAVQSRQLNTLVPSVPASNQGCSRKKPQPPGGRQLHFDHHTPRISYYPDHQWVRIFSSHNMPHTPDFWSSFTTPLSGFEKLLSNNFYPPVYLCRI